MNHTLIVHDPVHGSIKVGGVFADILDRHEMQRLRGVKQLGSANLVFPGANHSRFEHCLGAYHLAGRMSDALELDDDDSLTVRAAALIHDICHAPFSHTLEGVMEDATGRDHMELARALVKGEIRTCRREDDDLFGGRDSIGEVMSDAGLDPDAVCGLVSSPQTTDAEMDGLNLVSTGHFASKDYLHQMIHGPVDVDQMDYLMRDSHYTGVTAGHIDLERILSTVDIRNDRLCVRRSGSPAAEGLMVARSLMYTSIYFHQSIRSINRMVVKAVQASDLDLREIYLWDDADLSRALIECGGVASELMRKIRCRRFYKPALILSHQEISGDTAQMLARYTSRKRRNEIEGMIADRAGVNDSDVCVVMSSPSSLKSMATIGKTDVAILEPDGRILNLSRISPMAKSLQTRDPFGWSVAV